MLPSNLTDFPASGYKRVFLSVCSSPLGVMILKQKSGFCGVVLKRNPSLPLNVSDQILAIGSVSLLRHAGVNVWNENIQSVAASRVRRVVVDRPLTDPNHSILICNAC